LAGKKLLTSITLDDILHKKAKEVMLFASGIMIRNGDTSSHWQREMRLKLVGCFEKVLFAMKILCRDKACPALIPPLAGEVSLSEPYSPSLLFPPIEGGKSKFPLP